MEYFIINISRDASIGRARDNKGYLHVSKDNKGCLIMSNDE